MIIVPHAREIEVIDHAALLRAQSIKRLPRKAMLHHLHQGGLGRLPSDGGTTAVPDIDDIAMVARFETWKETPVSDGTAVSQFTDWSGNGNHVTQGTGSNQPLYKTSQINLRPAWQFDGSNDYMSLTSGLSAMNNTALRWFFAVHRKTGGSTSGSGAVFSLYNDNANNGGDLQYGNTASSLWRFTGSGNNYTDEGTGTGRSSSNYYYDSLIGDGTNVVWRGLIGGTFSSTTTTTPTGPPNGNVSLSIGRHHASNTFYMQGFIAAFFMGSGTLSGTNETRIRAYLNAVFGVQTS